MTERFRKAYDALVRAYFEGTLAKGTCMACACGNIIFSAIGRPIKSEDLRPIVEANPGAYELWASKRNIVLNNEKWEYIARPGYENEVNAAGYTAAEFAMIENAFESNTRIDYKSYPLLSERRILEDQYNGLCAVVDVLLELDEAKENPDELKKKFREHPKLETV